ncbi:MAG: hypothetical protein IT285_05480 [Bdellovibrionales bacterium]|nr:hypothetical protein [Bdellovibrionales bacterium]
MWDLRANYGPYSYAARLRRAARARLHKASIPKLKLLRVEAQVRPEPRGVSLEARVFLADLFPRAVFLFARLPFVVDTEISVTLSWPRQIFMKGRVASCTQVGGRGAVISGSPFVYRVSVELTFGGETERLALEEHVLELRSRYLFDQPVNTAVEGE